MNAASYPTGGPDPLLKAWAKAETEEHILTWDPILLPVERIGMLICT